MKAPTKTTEVKEEDVVLVETKAVAAEALETFKGRTPADWIIVPSDGAEIQARNNTTGEVFEGTLAEFNKRLG